MCEALRRSAALRPVTWSEYMKRVVKAFLRQEAGAVSVDFVAITAAIAGLGVAVFLILAQAAEPRAGRLGQELSDLDFESVFASN